ncbi:MAG: response regulator [Nitrospirae bacterium]|nr:response regulator [Candidatus Manganitrophaceae bacterium]
MKPFDIFQPHGTIGKGGNCDGLRMTMENGAKRRKSKRVLVVQDVAINGRICGQAIDLSIEGMYITTPEKFEKNAFIDLKFQLEDQLFQVKAKVLYLHEGLGFGVRFFTPLPTDVSRLKEYIEKLSLSRSNSNPHLKKILIIDDTQFYQAVYRQRLLSEGFSVLVAQNGVEGLKLLLQERPSLILLDLIMDGMDGFKVLQIIQSQPEMNDIPIIITSVKGATREISRAMELGAVDFLVKATTSPNKVVEKIKEVLRHRRPIKS